MDMVQRDRSSLMQEQLSEGGQKCVSQILDCHMQTMDVLIALLKPKQDTSRAPQQQPEASSSGGFHSAFADASSSASAELDASIKQATVQV